MPDHVHLIVTPFENISLQAIMQTVKSASSHLINRRLRRSRRLWQRESFDHILRGAEKLSQKIDYVCDNPVRKGLAATADQYRWLWRQWV
jgi:REP element-mobilizing transposase RayT